MVAIVSRASWGANPLNTPAGTIAVPTPDVWLHHTGGDGHGASYMRALQSGAINGGYVDLEYTYVVDTDGTVYMSRGPAHNTAATGGDTNGQANNARSHAICAMGNFENAQPTDAMLSAIASLLPYMKANGWIAQAAIDGPHQDAPGNATACCGKNLIARIGDINRMAGSGGGEAPTPEPKGSGAMELVTTPSGNGYYIVDSTGAVFAYGDAKYCGGANTEKLNAPIVGMDVRPQNDGYWLLAADGGVFAYGKAGFKGAPTGHVH